MTQAAWPNFLIVGAAKSGSTALAVILNQHPDVFVPADKECHYLLFDGARPAFPGPGDDDFNAGVITSQAEYEALFAGVRDERAVGEASVYYLYRHDVIDRIAARVPGGKAIAILREPASRAFSAYSHLVRDGREAPDATFEESLGKEEERRSLGWEYIWRLRDMGLYAQQVRALQAAFGRDNTLVLRYDDLDRDPAGLARHVFEFLGVDPSFRPDVSVRPNVSGKPRSQYLHRFSMHDHPVKDLVRPLVPASLFARVQRIVFRYNLRGLDRPQPAMKALAQTFGDDLAELEGLTGLDLAPWRDFYR